MSVRRRFPLVWRPHPRVIPRLSHPIQRLGRWDGDQFVPVGRGSITAKRIHVMCHGWAPGLGPVVGSQRQFLRVWDEAAVTPDGKRFDRWYPQLAKTVQERDPKAAVLGYTWIDSSATDLGAINSARSQLYTDLAAQGLAIALRTAIARDEPDIHLVGFSHGSKVVTVAGLLLDHPPAHLTLLDSPEGLLPVIGGAFNDLTPYLRLYDIGRGPGRTFVDSYPSAYGVHYGVIDGLGDIVEVALDAEEYPLEEAHNRHAYAHVWYCASADFGVGLAWSPLFADSSEPGSTQLRQEEGHDPWALEPNPEVTPAPPLQAIVERIVQHQGKPLVLGTEGRRSYWTVGWRRRGDFAATSRIRWISGPPEAMVSLNVQGRQRWRSRSGWSEDPVRSAAIPLGGLRSGPMISRLRIESSEPAQVEIQRAAISGYPVPTFEEIGSWVAPTVRTFAFPFTALAGGTAWRLARFAAGAIAGVRSKPTEDE